MTLMNASQQSGLPIREATADAFKAILVSPHFLFVVETESEAGGVQPLTPHQMATRLALFLWSSIPDEALMLAADANELVTDEQIIAQMRRMLADERSRALGENFGLQWLGLSQFEGESKPDTTLFPDFDERLAAEMREEAVRTVWNVFRDDRPLMELIDADSIHANATLASYYGLDASEQGLTEFDDSETWKRIPLLDRRRGGVITLAAVLTRSSYGHRTSPVLRGRWFWKRYSAGECLLHLQGFPLWKRPRQTTQPPFANNSKFTARTLSVPRATTAWTQSVLASKILTRSVVGEPNKTVNRLTPAANFLQGKRSPAPKS